MARAVELALTAAIISIAVAAGRFLAEAPPDERRTQARLGGPEPEDRLPAQTVNVYEYGFEPAEILIKTGQVVVWHNVGKELHRVAPRSQSGVRVFRGARARGTARHAFKRAGVYPYFCSFHPQMRGKVVVRDELPPA